MVGTKSALEAIDAQKDLMSRSKLCKVFRSEGPRHTPRFIQQSQSPRPSAFGLSDYAGGFKMWVQATAVAQALTYTARAMRAVYYIFEPVRCGVLGMTTTSLRITARKLSSGG